MFLQKRATPSSCRLFVALFLVVLCPLGRAKSKIGDRQIRELDNAEAADDTFKIEVPNMNSSNPCYHFSVVDVQKKEFYSPGPKGANYYSNMDCVLVLTAPPNHLVKLDFRDYFEIEKSLNGDCKNDYLEVRDGPYGFNHPLYDSFCGSEFPQELTSTDRHLWLRFKSDENIQYKGFRAVFDFVERPVKQDNEGRIENPEIMPCRINLEGLKEGFLGKSNISKEIMEFNERNNIPIDCLWAITVADGRRIQLQFQAFNLDKPNECDSNFIQVFSNQTDMQNMEKMFCGSIADTVNSKNNIMYLRFYNDPKGLKSTFEANFTEFRDVEKIGGAKQGCEDDEFDCEDATCIAIELQCNGRYNCRHRWDEDDCQGIDLSTQNLSLSEDHIIIIMIIFTLILSGMCFTFIFNCVKKLVRDHHTIQEYIRQSREQELNELDKQETGEKKLPRTGSRSRSGSCPSSESQRFEMANAAATPCYVPGGELLPILIRSEHSLSPGNGDAFGRDIYAMDGERVPEMCDSACQTRESLFTTQGYSSGNSTPNHSAHTNSPPAPFSTFGYKKDRFKAEARIEVAAHQQKAPSGKFEEKRRPYSVQTTKSAPDVIVTH